MNIINEQKSKTNCELYKQGWHMSAFELYHSCPDCGEKLQIVNKKSLSQDFICTVCKHRFRLDLAVEKLSNLA